MKFLGDGDNHRRRSDCTGWSAVTDQNGKIAINFVKMSSRRYCPVLYAECKKQIFGADNSYLQRLPNVTPEILEGRVSMLVAPQKDVAGHNSRGGEVKQLVNIPAV